MFIAHFENGESIKEKDVEWDDLPWKDTITSLQLVHTPFDMIHYFRESVWKLMPVLNMNLKPIGQDVLANIDKLIRMQERSQKQKIKVIKQLALKEIYDDWNKLYKKHNEAIKTLHSVKAPQEDIEKEQEQMRRIKYWVSVLRKLFEYKEFWRNQEKNCVSLTGSEKYKYYFFQFKHGSLDIMMKPKIASRSDFISFTPESYLKQNKLQYQEIGMVVDQFWNDERDMLDGHCICAKMDMVTGWTKTYYTTIRNMGLNLDEIYKYIDLTKLPIIMREDEEVKK